MSVAYRIIRGAAVLASISLLALSQLSVAQPFSTPFIQEVLYDGPGADPPHVFTELCGPPGMALDGWTLVGINGDNGLTYRTVSLTGAVFPATGLLVIATAQAKPELAAVRHFIASVDWQNGPDAVQLIDPEGQIVDALQYGDAAPFNAGKGTPAPLTAPGQSLSRDMLGTNTGDNAADFSLLDDPTPGVGPTVGETPVPPPVPPPDPPPTEGIGISLPDLEAARGDTIFVPVQLGEVSGLGIVAVELAIGYDRELLTALSVSSGELFSPAWILAQQVAAGAESAIDTLKIAMATATDTLDGAGRLLDIVFAVADLRHPASSALSFEEVVFNTDSALAVPQHGSVLLTGADGILSLEPAHFLPPDSLTVTVFDPDESRNPGLPDTIQVQLTAAGQLEELMLVESSPYSGLFTGSIAVVFGTPVAGNGVVELLPGEPLVACYEDLLTAAGGYALRCDTLSYRPGHDATLKTTRVLQPGDTLHVMLIDADLNVDPGSEETATVLVENLTTGQFEEVQLFEAGVNDSLFFGYLTTRAQIGSSGDGWLGIGHGDSLQVRYLDAQSSSGESRQVTAQAMAIGRFGDVDGNDRVQAFDAARVLAHALSPLLTGLDSLAANVDSLAPDGAITPYDAALILQYRVGLRQRFPVQLAGSANQPRPMAQAKASPDLRRLTIERQADYLSVSLDERAEVIAGELWLDGVTGQVAMAPQLHGFMIAARPALEGLHIVLAGPQPVSGGGELLRIYPDETVQEVRLVEARFNDGRIVGQTSAATAQFTPSRITLFPNYPNPFNPTTSIHFALPQAETVRLEIFDPLGKLVKTLVAGRLEAGVHRVVWQARDESGEKVGSGVYFYRLSTQAGEQTSRMVLLK